MKEEKLLHLIDRWSDDIVQFTCELVATPSVTPPGDEREIARLLLAKLAQLELNDATVASEIPQRPNVLCRLRGSGSGPRLLYVAHTDTKPVGEARNRWATDPLKPAIKDGRLYGLGSADMKAAISAFLYAAAALKQVDGLRGDLQLAFVADEEGGGRYGAYYLCTKYGLKADMAVIGEPPGITREWEYLHLGCRGVCCFTVKVHGTQMHSSVSDRVPSINASLKLANLMVRMSRELKLHYAPHPLCPGGVTINLGVHVQGGVYFGVYPGYAEFGTDVRTVPGMDREAVIRDIQAFLALMRNEDPDLRVELEMAPSPQDWIAPTEVGDDLPIAQSLARASAKVLGHRPPFGLYPAGTDSPKFQLLAGIPTIPAFGPGMISVCHGENEWVGVESIVQASKIYALAAYDMLK
jgi:acetylornithine deacetylase/succinyl-diaminopimelate desuccinylase-like protein